MEHNKETNAAYLPQEDYYDGGGYLGYGGYQDMQGCRSMFFLLLIIIAIVAIIGGLLTLL